MTSWKICGKQLWGEIMANFDERVNRRGTSCLKYDFAKDRGMPEDVLPFWVADMDFRTPEPVIEELVRRSRHGIFGYTDINEDYRETIARWFKKRHDWEPKTESLVITPGVVFAICAAIRAFTRKGGGVMISPPVYYPFSAPVRVNERRLVESPLVLKYGRCDTASRMPWGCSRPRRHTSMVRRGWKSCWPTSKKISGTPRTFWCGNCQKYG